MPVATERGGAERTLFQLLEHASDDAVWHVVLLERGPMADRIQGLGTQVTVLEAGRVRQLGRLAATERQLGRIFRATRTDVVVSWMPKAHLYSAPAARALGLPSVWFQHGIPSRTDPMDRIVAMLPTDAVLTPSRAVATAQHALWPHRATRVAYPGIDVDALTGAARNGNGPLAELSVPAGAPVVGLVARLQRWKGIHVLVAALPELLRLHPEARLVVVGGDHPLEPGYRGELEALAARLGVADRVHMAGYQADAGRWMREFDVVVHASDNEPFGLVILEAMALGKPLVAGARGGPAEIVRDGVEAVLVPFGDSRALAAGISDLLVDPERARRMGTAAALRAREFSPDRFAVDVLTTLTLVAENRGRARRSPL
jgi:glycosyltransferase involved in cell wall biosynthesis